VARHCSGSRGSRKYRYPTMGIRLAAGRRRRSPRQVALCCPRSQHPRSRSPRRGIRGSHLGALACSGKRNAQWSALLQSGQRRAAALSTAHLVRSVTHSSRRGQLRNHSPGLTDITAPTPCRNDLGHLLRYTTYLHGKMSSYGSNRDAEAVSERESRRCLCTLWSGHGVLKSRANGQCPGGISQASCNHPDYVPAYQMAAQMLAEHNRHDEARQWFANGIAAARRTGNIKAATEMEGMLAEL